MSVKSELLYNLLKLSKMKKLYSLPKKQLLAKIEQMNKGRGFYMPRNKKVHCKKHLIFEKYHCLIVQNEKTRSKRAILYFFGGGMMMGPIKIYYDVICKLAKKTGCDIWLPLYPLCTKHCITETYEMIYECYRQMCELYGGGNVSTCGFSSGAALAIGIASYNNTLRNKLPMPRHIVAVSPGEVPWNDKERAEMKKHNQTDVMLGYGFMEKIEDFMRHGKNDVPEFMIHTSKGDFSGVDTIHFFYSEDEVLYGALENFRIACKKNNVNFRVISRPKMVHCYCVLPYFKEAKEDFEKIVEILRE